MMIVGMDTIMDNIIDVPLRSDMTRENDPGPLLIPMLTFD